MGIISTRCESLNSSKGMHAPQKAVEQNHWFTDVVLVQDPEGDKQLGTRNSLMVVFCVHCGRKIEDYYTTLSNQIVE